MEWSQPYPAMVYILAGAALLLCVWAARQVAISPSLRSWLLFVPRIVVFAGLIVILLNPVRLHETQLPPRRSSVVYLVDVSRSMALDEPASRLDQAKRAIYQASRSMGKEDLPRIDLYRFGKQFSAAPAVPQLLPLDDATHIEQALQQLPSRFQKDVPKAVVVFSDGQFDETQKLEALAATFQRLDVPISVFPIGDQDVRGDVAISELIAPRRVQPGTKVPIRTTVRGTGFDGERVLLQIRPADSPGAAPLATLPITVSSTPQPCEMVIEAHRDMARYVVEATTLPGEAIVANNRVPFQLTTGDRKLRVLYMEGTGGQEYRFIERALTEDPDIECVSMVVDTQYAARPRLQRVRDPYRGYPTTREELFKFDVVICSDISQGAFTREQIEWTAELVGRRGGGFAMVGGHSSFGAGRWDQTAWDKLIPVDMAGGQRGRGYLTHQFRVTIPEQAQDHPIWQLVDDPAKNRQALAKMPQLFGTNVIKRLKPAATLLGESATRLPSVGIMPVFACETYGRGRTFAFSSDSTSYWGQDFERYWGEGDNRYFRKFWRNTVRWLSENSVSGSKRLVVETDKIIYRPGEPIKLTAVAYDASYHETTDYRLVAYLKPNHKGATAMTSATMSPRQQQSRYGGQVTANLPDSEIVGGDQSFSTLRTAKVEVVATDAQREIARSAVDVQLLYDSPELQRPQPAHQQLARLASGSGGDVLNDVAALSDLLGQFPATPGEVLVRRSPVWDKTWLWVVLLCLLTFEWSVRRRSGFG